MAIWHLPSDVAAGIRQLALPLHARLAGRLRPLMVGVLFAQGRRTVSSWLRGSELGRDFRAYYYFLGAVGRKTESMAWFLLYHAIRTLDPGPRVLFALDDTPTKRYGRHVQGAGIHHNPTPGPAEQKFLYGHIWVTLAWVLRHPRWGAIGLPLRALLYVRQKQIGLLPVRYQVRFRTKLEMAAELIEWLESALRSLGKTVWIVADGAYAKRPVLRRAVAAGVVVVSRLRKDAALRSVPTPPRPGQPKKRGRKPIYGPQAMSLAKRAAHARGWQTETFTLYGQTLTKTYKTFWATYEPVGGMIRVVLVREESGWVAFFCTAVEATVSEILEAVADRAALEQDFHDLKEVHGLGQQQVRNYWANLGAYHVALWLHTLVELWAWARPHEELCDRRSSPWDDADRRPSHADRCKALRRSCVHHAIPRRRDCPRLPRQFHRLVNRLLKLVA